MDKIEYTALKKTVIAEHGADDADSLKYHAKQMKSSARMFKWMAIFMGIVSIPMMLIVIGFITLPIAIVIYFKLYRKPVRMADEFIALVDKDPEFTS